MKTSVILKIITDLAMTVLLLLLMAFERVGRTAHEWIGLCMFFLFILHHVLNRRWIRNLPKGRYTPVRILQTVSAALVFFSMLGSFLSAVPISETVFDLLPVQGGTAFGRTLHLLCAYWGFVLLSFHLGLHWDMLSNMTEKALFKSGKSPSRLQSILLRAAGLCIALYGICAFYQRGLWDYMTYRSHFAFFDFEEPLLLFFFDHICIMGLFIFLGRLLMKAAAGLQKKRSSAA